MNPELPPELEGIINKCQEKDREMRYQSAAEVRTDLKRLKREIDSGRSSTRQAIAADSTIVTSEPSRKQSRIWQFVLGALVLVALAIGVGFYLRNGHQQSIRSLAVLPFLNINADPKTEYLSDGITETTINSLSQLPRLRVMARGTVFTYKGKEVDPRKVGRDLNVDAVVTGSVNQQQDTLIIRADLVQVSDGAQLWGERYSRKLSDILAVQSDISKQISEQLRLKLTGEELQKVSKKFTNNTEAYQLYLQGRYFWNKRSEEGLKRATGYFQQAIQKDPGYAMAYAGLADCYIVLADFNLLSPSEARQKSTEAAEKALMLDESLAEAHNSFASTKELFWEWKAAEEEYKRAIELNPNYATAHHWYSIYLANMGRGQEALAEIKRAQELDPLSLVITKNVGDRLLELRRYDDAIVQYRKTADMDPNFTLAHEALGIAYSLKGMYNDALNEYKEFQSLSEDDTAYFTLSAITYARWGKKEEAYKNLNALQELSKRKYVSPMDVAAIYAALGEKDKAFEWLEKAYQERSTRIANLKSELVFDSIRTDPRFIDLMQRVGLPQ